MKPRLLSLLACPIDRSPLELIGWEESERKLTHDAAQRAESLGIMTHSISREVTTGILVNHRLRLMYPVVRGVPRMLVFPTAVHAEFAAQHEQRLRREFPGYEFPNLPAAPGERDVLRSFSIEWTEYDWDGESYWSLDPETWFRCMRVVLGAPPKSLDGKRVLEVGIGIGATADHIAREDQCEVVGIDLGYAVDAAYRHFGGNPFLHVVQGSVFAPAFPEETFDFVYSFGVIHHTYSTKAAFDQLSRLPNRAGKLFVWVYSPWHEQRNGTRRLLMAVERLTRPVISRLPAAAQTAALLPFVPLYMGHQALRRLSSGPKQVLYGPREALHAARDRFTPRYIHRHDESEMRAWFLAAGYRQLLGGSELTQPDFMPEAFLVCTSMSGIRDRSALADRVSASRSDSASHAAS